MNKVIFTADDFGVIPSVNAGITDLVNRGLINSVETFTNYHKSVENVQQLLNDTHGANFELGAHLTITSGKPISGDSGLDSIVEEGSFLPFNKTNSRATDNGIYKEIKAQIERIMDVPEFRDKITHLTCHHDALWFFPEYSKQLARISKEFNFPIRTPISFPSKRDKLYYTVVLPLLKTFTFTREDVSLLKNAYKLRKDGYFPNQNLNFRAPDYMDSRHYGPIPGRVITGYNKADWILKKQKALAKMLRKAVNAGGKRDTQLIELMFHFRKGPLDGGFDTFKAEMDACDYTGIDHKYFDSRTVEFESLRFFEEKVKELIGAKFELGSWTQSSVKTLKKRDVDWAEDVVDGKAGRGRAAKKVRRREA
ncbi:MAG: ChbG/HpnK family deacetylase [Crocinitomix sp.]|nr:ChbG/HpnK family deacetylase [Crocinitomix sp.]